MLIPQELQLSHTFMEKVERNLNFIKRNKIKCFILQVNKHSNTYISC